MSDHPKSTELKALLRGELPPQQMRVVVAHLLKGCRKCRSEMAPLMGALFAWAGTGAEPQPDAARDAAYDVALDHAFESALHVAKEELAPITLDEQAPTPRAEQDRVAESELAACAALLEHSRARRHDDPARMIDWARKAAEAADALSIEMCGAARVADARALAWAELANAHRVGSNLREAETLMMKAFALRAEGTGNDLLAARLFDLKASLLDEQLRSAEAIGLLDAVHDIYLRHGDRHNAGRAMISKAMQFAHIYDFETSNDFLVEGNGMIDPERDPHLALIVVHNLAGNLMELGRLREARELLRNNLWRYRQVGGKLDRLKLIGLCGRIDAGLGSLPRAERELTEAKRGFDEIGLHYWSALAALDLGTVQLQGGRPADARAMAEEAIRLFRDAGVGREELTALAMLGQAVEIGAGATVFESVARFMRRVKHDPTARFALGQS